MTLLGKLREAAQRFREEGSLPPTAYKPRQVDWFIHLRGQGVHLEGPYKKELRPIFAPDRQRSGKPSKDNLKPYLLVDDARYVLGLPEEGKAEEAKLLHEGFKELVRKAWEAKGNQEVKAVLDFLESPGLDRIREEFRKRGGKPRDVLAFKVNGHLVTDIQDVQDFWVEHLEEENRAKEGYCALCGRWGPVSRLLPREVVVLGQKCALISFNQKAFVSFGKEQTENAPLCFKCAAEVVDALNHLITHHSEPLYVERDGGLNNQLAVFWLSRKVEVPLQSGPVDLEKALAALMAGGDPKTSPLPPELSQLEALLQVPWTGKEWALNLDETGFHLAVLSANKGRLVVREWFATSLAPLRENLSRFLEATRLVLPEGEEIRPVPVGALGQGNPSLVRGLLRTAYLGTKPPTALSLAVHALKNPKVLNPEKAEKGERAELRARLHALVSALKVWLFYEEREVGRMAELDREARAPAYLLGRLLAVLEEAQKRASNYALRRTLVERFYGAASTAPAATFGMLVRLATIAHLPKVGKELRELLEELLFRLDEAGGFPRTLNLAEQAEFALGFYHQRASFRANRGGQKSDEGGT